MISSTRMSITCMAPSMMLMASVSMISWDSASRRISSTSSTDSGPLEKACDIRSSQDLLLP